MDAKLRALNRFGLGARVGERATLNDPRAWLLGQIKPDVAELPEAVSNADMSEALRAYRMAGPDNQRERQQTRQQLMRLVASQQQATLAQRVRSTSPFAERMVAFWSNHLCVSAAAKLPVSAFAASYERDVIRRHVFGRFEDMVLASARHPAMLFYLDNFQSIGPNSRASQFARRGGQQRGLNENYARELLELHTLGVDGGYSQSDVTELARMFTGWTLSGFNQRDRGGAIEFNFAPNQHEPGTKTLLGVKYDQSGEQEGERAIRALCRHPSTAKFVARKLVQHFISDEPPAAAVERIAKVFAQSDGNLSEVTKALVQMPEAWTADTRKFRTPQDWLIAVLRAFSANDANVALLPALRQLRHPLWSPQAPKGFGDTLQEWADPDSLLNRAELARTIGKRVARSTVDPRVLLDVVDVASNDPMRMILSDASINAEERVALALAAPAFQWR